MITSAKENECNFLIATPPCQGMSTAGRQLKDDPRNRLIVHVVEAIKEIRPIFAIIENVPEILQTKIEIDGEWVQIDDYLKSELANEYRFNDTKVVNAMYYGVAQSRDVIGDLPSLDPYVTDVSDEERNSLFPKYAEKKQEGLKVSKWHVPPRHKYRHVIAMMHTPEGNSAWGNETYYPTLADGTKSKGYKNTYKRQWWDKPAYTVTKYTSRIGSQENGHPGRAVVDSPLEEKRIWSDARVLTIFELMRVSSLPDDWNIPEEASSNVIREIIGEGVPPRLLECALIELEHLLDGRD